MHRDVKPGNVLLSPDGVPRLVDLGAVQLPDAEQATLTVPGTMVGTIGYVAPKQLDGIPADARADVFSPGLLLHECLTGEPAFGKGTLAEMTRRLVDGADPASVEEMRHQSPSQPASGPDPDASAAQTRVLAPVVVALLALAGLVGYADRDSVRRLRDPCVRRARRSPRDPGLVHPRRSGRVAAPGGHH